MEKAENLLEVENLCKYFSRGKGLEPLKAVDNFSFKLKKGGITGIVGESGSGKSTALRCIARLYDATEGRIILEKKDLMTMKGKELQKERKNMQIIFQDPYSSLDPYMTVNSIIAEPVKLFNRRGMLEKKLKRKEIEAYVIQLLEKVGLDAGYVSRRPNELSGGQCQRVAIARALALRPKLILADEAVSSLDAYSRMQITELFLSLKEEYGLSYIFVSHDLALLCSVATEIIVMYSGRIMEKGNAEELCRNPKHPYTKLLLESSPSFKEGGKSKWQAEQEEEMNEAGPCPFYPRCRERMECCRYEMPLPYSIGRCHEVSCLKYRTFIV